MKKRLTTPSQREKIKETKKLKKLIKLLIKKGIITKEEIDKE